MNQQQSVPTLNQQQSPTIKLEIRFVLQLIAFEFHSGFLSAVFLFSFYSIKYSNKYNKLCLQFNSVFEFHSASKNKMFSLKFVCLLAALVHVNSQDTLTTASGSRAPAAGSFNSGDLIFEDTFDNLDFETWQHENTVAGGGNWEFQWYANNRSNSYVEDGNLHIVPTTVAEEFGEAFLTSGVLNLHGGAPADECTNAQFWGCERQGTPVNILNPIKSARLRTVHSFSFRYGTLEVRAKVPAGDWLW
jgi:hypothetical protein